MLMLIIYWRFGRIRNNLFALIFIQIQKRIKYDVNWCSESCANDSYYFFFLFWRYAKTICSYFRGMKFYQYSTPFAYMLNENQWSLLRLIDKKKWNIVDSDFSTHIQRVLLIFVVGKLKALWQRKPTMRHH